MSTIYAIGDIHGYYDELKNLHDKIMQDASVGDTVVLLGDYFDRGPKSKEVYEFLTSDDSFNGLRKIYLKGNHEQMFVDAFYNGAPDAQMFLRNGGAETLKSFNRGEPVYAKDFEDVISWIRELPYFHEEDGNLFVHAGVDPRYQRFEDNSKNVLVWIRDVFLNWDKQYFNYKYVIHGHTPTWFETGTSSIFIKENRINLDTGICFKGVLTCLKLVDGSIMKYITNAEDFWRGTDGNVI